MTKPCFRLVLPALIAAGLLFPMVALASPAHPPHGGLHTVTVEGHGEISVAPDRAKLSMEAETTDTDLQAAQKKVDEIVRNYVSKAEALGVAKKDLSTAGYNVQPQYDYVKGKREFRGYHVSRDIRLTVRNLDKIGDYLQAATNVGVTRISSPQLQSSEASKYRLQALAKAARDAQAQARTLAKALDVQLGSPRRLSTVDTPIVRPTVMRAMAVSASAKTAPSGNEQMGFKAGLIQYKAKVEATFNLDP